MALFAQLLYLLLLGVGFLALRRRIRQARFIKKHGCKEAPSLMGNTSFFGLDLRFLFLGCSNGGLETLPLERQFEVLGSTFRTQMAIRPVIRTMEPQNMQVVFSLDADSFGNRPLRHFSFSPLVGDGVMTLDGARHERARALIRPTFSKLHIENEEAYDVHVQKLINLLLTDGSTVDLQPLFERLDLDSSTEFIFGESVQSLDVSDSLASSHRFPAAFNVAQQGMGVRLRMLPFNFLHRDKKFWEACSTIRRFVAESVEKAMVRRQNANEETARSYILVDNVVQETSDNTEIQDTLMNVFLPGHDTIAILLSNIFFHLARNPRVWQKLRKQLLELPEITTGNLKRMDYLHHVINETLRVTPPVNNMTRIAVKDTALPLGGGPDGLAPVFVPKGTVIASSFYSVHHRKDIYGDDAEIWRPERWEELKLSTLAWKFIPFGGGVHVCPGQNLAMNRVAFTVARIVKVFDSIENRDPVAEFIPLYKLVTASQNGVKVSLHKANVS
uniref:Cytochrome P450 n=1 Tax=Talaromyces marneffei PM1 TaxID=1077442 RepID=A0A093W1C4_TALMA